MKKKHQVSVMWDWGDITLLLLAPMVLFSLVVEEVSPFLFLLVFSSLPLFSSFFSSLSPILFFLYPLSSFSPLSDSGQLGQGSNHNRHRPRPIEPFSKSVFLDPSEFIPLGKILREATREKRGKREEERKKISHSLSLFRNF